MGLTPAQAGAQEPGLARLDHPRALALIPLVIAGRNLGNEIQSPMGQVILGGLVTSTFLNMVPVPLLFLRYGERRSKAERARPA